jgi:hypothetical protein
MIGGLTADRSTCSQSVLSGIGLISCKIGLHGGKVCKPGSTAHPLFIFTVQRLQDITRQTRTLLHWANSMLWLLGMLA